MDDRGARDDQPDAAPRALLLEGDLAFRHPSVLDQSGAHRRLDDPVADRDAPDLARGEEVRVRALWVA